MHRLFWQVYGTVLLALVVVVALTAVLWRATVDFEPFEQSSEAVAEIVATVLPPDLTGDRLQTMLDRLHQQTQADLAVYGADGAVIASAGRPVPLVRAEGRRRHHRDGNAGPVWSVTLVDGRTAVARMPVTWRAWGLPVIVGAIALAVAGVALPFVHRLSRRIERLRSGVERLGGGDLSARVHVRGRDEVAVLARSFNWAAERLQALVHAHKMLLASVSHELRTPLARIRLGIELAREGDAKRLEGVRQDVAELDQMIDAILTSSRLDAAATPDRTDDVDLLALVAEEAAREDLAVSGTPVRVRGDGALLRRLVRNLVQNARRHAPGGPIDIVVTSLGTSAVLTVSDRGPGVPEAERERIFEPFYRLSTNPDSTGAGLGLALVRQIARRHHGDVHSLAREGGGSIFRVTLPAVATASA
ncbi:MAG: HAMP domain-containing histidine kinase [Alphaproteobacteria bacterium]|nr:HAMP domain-containing histidine kinase [Alphaproteobacteria bacterium]